MKQLKLLIILITLTLCSCSGPIFYFPNHKGPAYHIPNHQNVALLEGKGDNNINLTTDLNSYDLQTSYGISNHLAVQINSNFSNIDIDEVSFFNSNPQCQGGSLFSNSYKNININNSLLELGLGYMTRFKENYYLELFGLAARGGVKNNLSASSDLLNIRPGTVKADFLRFGLQSNLGVKLKKVYLAFSMRATNLKFKNITGNLTFNGQDQINLLNNNKNNLLLDPALTFRAGSDILKVEMQLGTSYNLSNPDFRQTKEYLRVGFNVNMNNYFNKIKSGVI